MSRVTPTGAALLLCLLMLVGTTAQLQAQTTTHSHHAQAHAQAVWSQQLQMLYQNWLAHQQMLSQQSLAQQAQQQASPQSLLNAQQTPQTTLSNRAPVSAVKKHLHSQFASPNQTAGLSTQVNAPFQNQTSLANQQQVPTTTAKQVLQPNLFSSNQPTGQSFAQSPYTHHRTASLAANQTPISQLVSSGSPNPPTTTQQCQNQQSLLFRQQDSFTQLVLAPGGSGQSVGSQPSNVQNQCLQQQALLNRATQTPTVSSQPSQVPIPTATRQRFWQPVQATPAPGPQLPATQATSTPSTTQQFVTPTLTPSLPQSSQLAPTSITSPIQTSSTSPSQPTSGQQSGLPTGQGSPILDMLAQNIMQAMQSGAYVYMQILNMQSIREVIGNPPQNSTSAQQTSSSPVTTVSTRN